MLVDRIFDLLARNQTLQPLQKLFQHNQLPAFLRQLLNLLNTFKKTERTSNLQINNLKYFNSIIKYLVVCSIALLDGFPRNSLSFFKNFNYLIRFFISILPVMWLTLERGVFALREEPKRQVAMKIVINDCFLFEDLFLFKSDFFFWKCLEMGCLRWIAWNPFKIK